MERQRALQGLALDVLHHQVVRPDIVQGADVGVVQRGYGAGFALEAFGEVRARELHGDGAVESGVAAFVHFAHPARADGDENFVWSQTGSGSQGHGVSSNCTPREHAGFGLGLDHVQTGSRSNIATVLLPRMWVLCARLCPILTHGVTPHLNAVGIVHEPVEDAVG